MKTKFLAVTVLTLLLVVACQTDSEDTFVSESSSREIDMSAINRDALGIPTAISSNNEVGGLSKSSEKRRVAVYMAEYITSGESDEMGNTVYFNNRGNKQLGGDFVPGLFLDDTDGTNDISYYVDDMRPSLDLSVDMTNKAIDRAMNTWNKVNCSDIGMFEAAPTNSSTGFIARQLSDLIYDIYGIPDYFGGSYDYFADVTHAGWMDPLFFDIIAEGGSQFILGVTFTIVWVDEDGNLTDVDKNGKYDVAWREIYYNDAFPWAVDGKHYDVETIALHEAGHGLSQGHFGKAFRNKGGLHFSPRAVMNAAYSGIQTSINKTDNGGHCSNWAQWPNN